MWGGIQPPFSWFVGRKKGGRNPTSFFVFGPPMLRGALPISRAFHLFTYAARLRPGCIRCVCASFNSWCRTIVLRKNNIDNGGRLRWLVANPSVFSRLGLCFSCETSPMAECAIFRHRLWPSLFKRAGYYKRVTCKKEHLLRTYLQRKRLATSFISKSAHTCHT